MWILTILLSILVAVFQTTVLPSLKIYGGGFDLILVLTLIFLYYGSLRKAGVFLLISSIVASIISGVAIIYILVPDFFVIVIWTILLSKRIISYPSAIFSIPIFFSASIIANLMELLIRNGFAFFFLPPLISSSLQNTTIGVILYYLSYKIFLFLNPQVKRERIIISNFK